MYEQILRQVSRTHQVKCTKKKSLSKLAALLNKFRRKITLRRTVMTSRGEDRHPQIEENSQQTFNTQEKPKEPW
jgi:non-ribosomal peptide synthetase component F